MIDSYFDMILKKFKNHVPISFDDKVSYDDFLNQLEEQTNIVWQSGVSPKDGIQYISPEFALLIGNIGRIMYSNRLEARKNRLCYSIISKNKYDYTVSIINKLLDGAYVAFADEKSKDYFMQQLENLTDVKWIDGEPLGKFKLKNKTYISYHKAVGLCLGYLDGFTKEHIVYDCNAACDYTPAAENILELPKEISFEDMMENA